MIVFVSSFLLKLCRQAASPAFSNGTHELFSFWELAKSLSLAARGRKADSTVAIGYSCNNSTIDRQYTVLSWYFHAHNRSLSIPEKVRRSMPSVCCSADSLEVVDDGRRSVQVQGASMLAAVKQKVIACHHRLITW